MQSALTANTALRRHDDLRRDFAIKRVIRSLDAQVAAHALQRKRHFRDGIRIERLSGQKRADRHNMHPVMLRQTRNR
jgi:hypothetical protein